MGERWFDMRTAPRVAQAIAVLGIVTLAIVAVIDRKILSGGGGDASMKPIALDFSRFHPLSIPEHRTNTVPHVATEGYVRDVHVDQEEKTLHFKLVQILREPEPFIVCEIISPGRVVVPSEGSFVRVYGVSRFDAKPGREWHEVNPVLNIAVLKR